MVKGQRFVLKHQFNGLPKKEDFDLIEEDLLPLKGIYYVQHSVEIQEFKCHSDFMWNHVSQNGTFWRDDEYVKLIH